MKQLLKIKQICFNPNQESVCDYEPFHNEDCTKLFENSVMSNLIANGDADDCEYYGVLSWNLRKKINRGPGPRFYSQYSGFQLKDRVNGLLESKPDIIGLVHYASHDNVKYWRSVHSQLEPLFLKVLREVSPFLECQSLEHNFYSNHFIARSDIYKEYVEKFLNPAMQIMEGMPELWNDSGYPFSLPADLRKKWNISHYPYFPFICERLFAYFVHLKRITNIKYY